MKIEPIDVKEYLSLKGKAVIKIKKTGKVVNSLAKSALQKFKNGFKKVLNSAKEKTTQIKDNVVDKVTDVKDNIVESTVSLRDKIVPMDEVETKKEEKLSEIQNKRSELKEFIGAMEQDDEYRIGENKYYLTEIKKTYRKLGKQQMKISKRGLGIFAVTKITLSNIKENIKNKWANYLEQKEEQKRQIEIEESKKRLAENLKEQLRLQNEARNIISQNPEELNLFFNELVKSYDNKEKENTETTEKKL